MILTIAGKELRTLFASPLAWVVLTVMQLIENWLSSLTPSVALRCFAVNYCQFSLAFLASWRLIETLHGG